MTGLPATVEVVNPERGQKLAIDAGNGKDTIDATGLVRDELQPTLKGGAGRDTLIGSPGDDVIAGGTDVDVALLGGGLDTFTWAPGDGNDIVEGQGGTDFLQMNGSGGNDRFDVVPVGTRTRVTRDIENVNVDLGGLERIDILPGPGGDILHVGDLSGTSTDHVDFNLMVARGQTGGDDTIDRVFVDGTFGNDTINVNGAGPDVRTTGLAAITTVRGTDPELDRLHVDTRPGPDTLTRDRDDQSADRLHVLLIAPIADRAVRSSRWRAQADGRASGPAVGPVAPEPPVGLQPRGLGGATGAPTSGAAALRSPRPCGARSNHASTCSPFPSDEGRYEWRPPQGKTRERAQRFWRRGPRAFLIGPLRVGAFQRRTG